MLSRDIRDLSTRPLQPPIAHNSPTPTSVGETAKLISPSRLSVTIGNNQDLEGYFDRLYQVAIKLNPKNPVIVFSGLSGSGKTTLANSLARYLTEKEIPHQSFSTDLFLYRSFKPAFKTACKAVYLKLFTPRKKVEQVFAALTSKNDRALHNLDLLNLAMAKMQAGEAVNSATERGNRRLKLSPHKLTIIEGFSATHLLDSTPAVHNFIATEPINARNRYIKRELARFPVSIAKLLTRYSHGEAACTYIQRQIEPANFIVTLKRGYNPADYKTS